MTGLYSMLGYDDAKRPHVKGTRAPLRFRGPGVISGMSCCFRLDRTPKATCD
jgi:hypothetical protein